MRYSLLAQLQARRDQGLPEHKFILGTRGSLLAITQSQQVLDEMRGIEKCEFQVKKIKTQGDQIVDKPLWQLEGKDFFTKELDEQLLKGEIDFVVHSYKDLGSERPEGIKLGAITKREYPHDILLMRKESINKKPNKLIIGTSSPRRQVNLTESLIDFIPWKVKSLKLENLRGNINTRIEKLIDKNYDGIVLAFAGIERLAKNVENQPLIQQYFHELDYMILPLSEFPTAAAQGALAIEYGPHCTDKLKSIIEKLHDTHTAKEVEWEKEKFRSYGGGCHLPMGITAQMNKEKFWTLAKGKTTTEDKEVIVESEFQHLNQEIMIPKDETLFIGLSSKDIAKKDMKENLLYDEIYLKKPIQVSSSAEHQYITSKHVLHAVSKSKTKWCAGTKSWQKLKEIGHWVNGCSDQFGEQHLTKLLKSHLLQLLHGKNFQSHIDVMTNEDAPINFGKRLVCYEREAKTPSATGIEKLRQTKHFFWMSFSQYLAYTELVPEIKEAKHYCGLGKSSERFADAEIEVTKVRNWHDCISNRD